jgi:Glyoxalase/Bleomycin resistance protein/Dioxygenase superfamily
VITGPFHAGLVVADLRQTMDELSGAFGLGWSSLRESDTSVWTPTGRVDLTFRGGFSQPGPTRLELIEAIPGTLWNGPNSTNLHHVSFWSSDLAADSRSLVEQGFPLVATTWTDGGESTPSLFAYHRKNSGPYMELLDERERVHYEEWWQERS